MKRGATAGWRSPLVLFSVVIGLGTRFRRGAAAEAAHRRER